MKRLVLGLIFGVGVIGVSAASEGLSAQYSTCVKNAGGETPEILKCIDSETAVQDKNLNNYYKQAISTINPSRTSALKESQRAWLKQRDAELKFYSDPDGGQAAIINANSHFMSMTVDRAKELKDISESPLN